MAIRLRSSPTDTSTSVDPRAGRAPGRPGDDEHLDLADLRRREAHVDPLTFAGHRLPRGPMLIVGHEAATALEIAGEARGAHGTDRAAEQGVDGGVRCPIVDPRPHPELIAVVTEREDLAA